MSEDMKRRTVLSLLTLAAAGAAAGCDGHGGGSGHAALEFQYQKSTSGDPIVQWYTESVRTYEAAHRGVTVKAVSTLSGNDYLAKVTSEMATNTVPDIFVGWGYNRLKPYARARKVADLTDALKAHQDVRSHLPKGSLDAVSIDGHVYGLPLVRASQVIFYNRKIFSKNGLSEPRTYEQFLHAIDTLKSHGIVPIALGNKETWNGSILFTFLAQSLGGHSLYEDTVVKLAKPFDNPTYVKAGRMLQDIIKIGAFSSDFETQDTQYAAAYFAAGKAAMWINTTSQIPTIYGSLGADLGWFKFPGVPGGKNENNMVGSWPNVLVVGTGENSTQATDFVMYLMSEQRQKALAKRNQLTSTSYNFGPGVGNKLTRSLESALQSTTYLWNAWDTQLGVYLGEKFDDATEALYQGKDPASVLSNFDKEVKTSGTAGTGGH